jgi:dTDP-4-dehydrorhamnose 3,5-epimerase
LKLQVTPTSIRSMLIIESRIFGDERGWFTESFNTQDFSVATGLNVEFVQDNHSFSRQWTLRGLHYQMGCPQGKLVRVIAGRIFDVVVDIRKDSPTFGQWLGIEVDSQNHRQLWIPEGLAHGFLALTETAEVLYKTTDYYHPQSEVCLAWNDPSVGIEWPLPEGVTPNMNAKDAAGLLWDFAPKF